MRGRRGSAGVGVSENSIGSHFSGRLPLDEQTGWLNRWTNENILHR